MKKHLRAMLWLACIAVGFYFPTQAQSITLDPSNTATGVIDAKSTTKGFVMPRMTEAQRTAISSPVAGTQIYCTNCSGGAGSYTYNGSVWVPMFNTAGITYVIGQSVLGGKVFYVDETGQHGLIVAPADYNAGEDIKWLAASNMNTNAVRSGIYGGEFNTERINEVQGNGISAALAASRYEGGNYGDWYLPSKIELQLLYQQRASVGMGSNSYVYWSSTEVATESGVVSFTAYYFNFDTGTSGTNAKSTYYKVRPIRRF